MLFGELDAHLHRPAGVHRVKPAEQRLAQWQAGDDFVVQRTQLLLAAHGQQPLLVALAVAGRRLQRAIHQQAGNVQARGAAVDFVASDFAQRFLANFGNLLGKRIRLRRADVDECL